MDGHGALMSFWHRPLHAMTDAFTAADFPIGRHQRATARTRRRELFPEILPDVPPAFLCFLFFVLQAD
jgi:hypothetical protein